MEKPELDEAQLREWAGAAVTDVTDRAGDACRCHQGEGLASAFGLADPNSSGFADRFSRNLL